MSATQWREFAPLRDSRLQVARAWAIKEAAMLLWGYDRRGWAERMWGRWYQWAIRSRLEPIKRVARMRRGVGSPSPGPAVPQTHPICYADQGEVCFQITRYVVASSDAPNDAFLCKDLPAKWQCVNTISHGYSCPA